jgi:hypothetical protein
VLFRSCSDSDIQNLTRVTCYSDCNKSTSQASLFLCPGSTNTRIGTRNLVSRSFYSADATTYNEQLTVQSPTHAAQDKVGVLLLNLGGPETLDDVQPFLFNLFADPVCYFFLHFSYYLLLRIHIIFMLIVWSGGALLNISYLPPS